LAVLGYHKIGPPPPGGWETWFYIPESVFVAQLESLHQGGWEVIDVGRFLRGLDDPGQLPRRAALLTFDDGCRSFLDVALPCLERLGFPAVMFVPTDSLGGRNDFDEGCEPEESICDWNDLRDLCARGVSVQSHTASHRRLSSLDTTEREHEFRRSKELIESALGEPVSVLAYPFGDDGGDSETVASELGRAGYQAAFLYGGGVIALPIPDRFRIARLAMGPDTDLEAALAEQPAAPSSEPSPR
jgi:peptidoglycan/xylan/chitin deacetylase (PgdA/CDA1 family)